MEELQSALQFYHSISGRVSATSYALSSIFVGAKAVAALGRLADLSLANRVAHLRNEYILQLTAGSSFLKASWTKLTILKHTRLPD